MSGGERRPPGLALALLARTRASLDEPTSGLDPAAASVVLRHVSRIAAGSRVAVVAAVPCPPPLISGASTACSARRGWRCMRRFGAWRGQVHRDVWAAHDTRAPR